MEEGTGDVGEEGDDVIRLPGLAQLNLNSR